jgi:ferric-dicitrate binding protein FerR (iron transport regulator)
LIDKNLIEKFLKGECHGDEAAHVMLYLRQHPAELEEFLPEEEWDKYVSNPSSNKFDEEIYRNIHRSIHRDKKNKAIITAVISAAAVLVLFFGIRYLTTNNADSAIQQAGVNKTETIKKNNSTLEQLITLPDNSIITLAAGSEIRYASDYNRSRRDIFLTGKAEFSVAKGKEKQFTVYCGKVATTALGTRFSVDGNASTISVVLYEGKVVVKKLRDETMANYLQPGDKIRYNIKKDMFEEIRDTKLASNTSGGSSSQGSLAEKNKVADKDSSDSKPQVSHNDTELADNRGRINFQNENLKTVLDQLAERFKVEINYPTEITASINVFISVDTTQSIDKILQNIAAINNLEVKKVAEKKFYISR